MTTESSASNSSSNETSQRQGCDHSARGGKGHTRRVAGFIAFLVGLPLVVLATGAFARGGGGPGMGFGFPPPGPMFGHGRPDADEMRMILEHRLDKVLDRVDATEAQRSQIKAIAARELANMPRPGDEKDAVRAEIGTLLTADKVDASAAEALRARALSKADEHSQHLVAAVVEAANVLTKEQRQKLLDQMSEGPGFGRW